jgi:EAL domain-containing protein (putative c-di-GMP-specific phosphodiesterase class I)
MANHLPIAVEFAATATYLLGEGLRARRSSSTERRQIESILATQSFKPVFQPVVDMEQGLAIGFEALTRFDASTPADQVFESAVTVGLGLDLEVATLRASIRAAEGLPDGPWLSLNVSPGLVLESDRLRDLLAAQSRPIVLEITEHVQIADYEALRSAYLSLGSGIRLAVDDAGAGAANFEHILELRPDFLKIDIGFVRGVDMDLTRQALIAGLRHFALATNCLLIAEGVETEAQRNTLRTLGLHLGQGFLLGRPAEAAQWR